jgi:putative molybdopterin biosynthesis protein
MEKRILLTAEQVAERLQISQSFAYTLMSRGEIPTVRLGRSVRVRPQDLEKYIESNIHNPTSTPS